MEWFKHDVNAHDDIKIRKLVRMHGMQAYGFYWYIVELLYGNGGEIQKDTVVDEGMIAGIEQDDLVNIMDSFLELELFIEDPYERWTSDRVTAEIRSIEDHKEYMRQLGRKGASARYSARQADAKQNDSARYSKRREDKKREDYNLGSPLQEESLSINTKDKTDKTEIVCSEPSQRLEAGTPENAVFVTIISNKGEEIPITESMVSLWEKTYPAVDVRSELLRMKSWAIANPKNRKTRSGMQRFCDNWLARTQNEARRIPQGNHETIRGTNIRMSLVADGTRPEYPEPEVKFE